MLPSTLGCPSPALPVGNVKFVSADAPVCFVTLPATKLAESVTFAAVAPALKVISPITIPLLKMAVPLTVIPFGAFIVSNAV